MIKIKLVAMIFICLLVACVNNQKDSLKLFKSNLDYFLQTQYSNIDTIRHDNNLSFIFYYKDYFPNEKIYVSKDTIKHVFGMFDDEGTMWLNELLVYNSNGKIIDDQSQYIVLKEFNDSVFFELIGDSELDFEIRTYDITPDSSNISQILETYKSENKTLQLSLKDIKGHPVVAVLKRKVEKENSLVDYSELDFFINKKNKDQTTKHLNLIDDMRLIK